MLRRHLLFMAFLFSGQFAVGQNTLYGDYKSTEVQFDSRRLTFHLSLKQDGSYTMQYPRRDSLATLHGKWWQKGDFIKLKEKYSKANKSYGLKRRSVLNIEGDRLIWKPTENKRKLEREMRKFEKEISKNAMEKVTLTVRKPDPLIFYKEN